MTELRRDLLGKWPNIHVERLTRLVTSMPRHRAVNMQVLGENTRHRIGHACNNTTSQPYAKSQHGWYQFGRETLNESEQ